MERVKLKSRQKTVNRSEHKRTARRSSLEDEQQDERGSHFCRIFLRATKRTTKRWDFDRKQDKAAKRREESIKQLRSERHWEHWTHDQRSKGRYLITQTKLVRAIKRRKWPNCKLKSAIESESAIGLRNIRCAPSSRWPTVRMTNDLIA
jgi:hypothetical protein